MTQREPAGAEGDAATRADAATGAGADDADGVAGSDDADGDAGLDSGTDVDADADPGTDGFRPAGEGDDGDTRESASATLAASEAFAGLGNETRLRIVDAVVDAPEPPTFTDLFEATDEETTAGFAYHLRQLVGQYVEKDEATETYRPTYAGRQVARALRAGTFTERVGGGPTPVDGSCPVCVASALEARAADNRVAVACTACDTGLLALPFPPNGVRGRSPEELLAAFDAHHRSRLALVAEGVCPDCAGRAAAAIERADPERVPTGEDGPGAGDGGDGGRRERDVNDASGGGANDGDTGDGGDGGADPVHDRPVLAADCEDCPFAVRAPVSLGVVEHPAVVSFYHDHGEELRDRPLWNLGPEWRERLLSTDPAAVRVSTRLDGEELRLLVGDGPTVVDAERRPVGGDGDCGADEGSGGSERPNGNGRRPAGTDAPDATDGPAAADATDA